VVVTGNGLILGRAGVWLGSMAHLPVAQLRQAVAEIERMGFGTIWLGEALGREPIAAAALILAATERVVVATGIANIYVRDPMAMANAARTLAEAWPQRFVLGIGVSHGPMVKERGHEYDRPVSRMRTYLEAMAEAPYVGPRPNPPAPVVLAALGVKMLELAGQRASGAHPYFVPVEHTREARHILGPDRILAPEQAVVVAPDRANARVIANLHMERYLRLENYRKNLARLGWSEADLKGSGSDQLFDALVFWGDEEEIARKVRRHYAAGADHVAVQVITPAPERAPLEELRRLAAHLGQ
jgi:probable F420-dependent oxidoreductase